MNKQVTSTKEIVELLTAAKTVMLGVAVIQALLAGAGFFLASVPHAGILGLVAEQSCYLLVTNYF